jgi:hypothetical protein
LSRAPPGAVRRAAQCVLERHAHYAPEGFGEGPPARVTVSISCVRISVGTGDGGSTMIVVSGTAREEAGEAAERKWRQEANQTEWVGVGIGDYEVRQDGILVWKGSMTQEMCKDLRGPRPRARPN